MNDFLRLITAQYVLFVFLVSAGVLQLAGARTGGRLCLLSGRRSSALLGVCLLASGYAFFFTQARYGARGLEGAQLFAYFGVGAVAALLVCSGINLLRSGQVVGLGRRLANNLRASVAELRPLFERPRS